MLAGWATKRVSLREYLTPELSRAKIPERSEGLDKKLSRKQAMLDFMEIRWVERRGGAVVVPLFPTWHDDTPPCFLPAGARSRGARTPRYLAGR